MISQIQICIKKQQINEKNEGKGENIVLKKLPLINLQIKQKLKYKNKK